MSLHGKALSFEHRAGRGGIYGLGRQVTQVTTYNFITNDVPNVKGIVMAGSADFKTVI